MIIVRAANLGLGLVIAWFIVAVYQRFVSPRLRSGERIRVVCRFHPSCSEYGVLALRKHGASAGVFMTLDRLRRCRPDNLDTCFDAP